ncbi:hypothetical protein K493DRAFT_339837 [Basidiobolus meristosporus CBS 931.73]|uniref:Autophagy-related protein 2 n=1 Tax=Basidiobolus meristosporus CBS 931.73 TaxID=1314790 RepID=A0A1Y1XYX9_9FUNG|nr:hypothetical protein K493DRAFT_339837 [Basidiobolus meristosporus CBS 931.73]|eukprot:ORX90696.1 hypothetical protein K493DRAFT_339837 [Basidiobolus meristosporus CBS 931.73]
MRGWSFSGWTLPSTLQKRLVKFLLKRAIGQFLLEELDLDNLDVQLGTGYVQLKELQLNTEVLNDLISELPVKITHGKIGGITAQVPWKDIWSGNCVLEFHNLEITMIPNPVVPTVSKSKFEDSHILSSSIHFAGDFLRHEVPDTDEGEELRKSIMESVHIMQNSFNKSKHGAEEEKPAFGMEPGTEGLQVLAGVIDNIISNVKVTFHNSKARIHHSSTSDHRNSDTSPQECSKDYYLDILVPSISYRDGNPEHEESSEESQDQNFSQWPMESVKVLTLVGLNISLHELEKAVSPTAKEKQAAGENELTYSATLLSTLAHENTIKIRTKRSLFGTTLPQPSHGPSWDVECYIQSIVTMLSPGQLRILTDIVGTFAVKSKNPRSGYFDDDLTNASYREDMKRRSSYQRRRSSTDYLNSPNPAHGSRPVSFAYSENAIDEENEQFYSIYEDGQESDNRHDQENDSYMGRLKVHISSWRSYFLGSDVEPPPEPDSETLSVDNPGELEVDHILVHLEDVIARIKKWQAEVGNFPTRGEYEMNSKDKSNLQMLLEMYTSKIDISEWIKPTADNPVHDLYHTADRGVYLPILRFDPDLNRSYDSSVEVSMNPPRGFPSFYVNSKPSQPTKQTFMEGKKMKDAFRLRLTVANSADSPYDIQTQSDIVVESQSFHVFLNPQIINRYHGYFPANEQAAADKATEESGFGWATGEYDEQGIIKDLDERAFKDHTIRPLSTRFRIRTDFLRIWLTVPDLRGTLSLEEAQRRQSECRIHEDMLILDLIDPTVTNFNTNSSISQMLQSEFLQRFYPYRKESLPFEAGQSCIRFEWVRMNVFLKEATDPSAMCFLVISPMVLKDSLHRILPNIEVTTRVQNPKSPAARNKAPQTKSYFPKTFSSFEGEERVKLTDEDEEEEIVMFKQRTLENSIYAINCSLPNVYVILTKHRYDLIQTLLDSFSRWQLYSNPGDTALKTEATTDPSPMLDQVDVFGNADGRHGCENLGEQTNTPDVSGQLDNEPTYQSLASFVSVIHNMDVIIICSTTTQPSSTLISPPKFYELQLSELGFFGAVRFEGKSVSYFNLDIEEISLSDVTAPISKIPIISKVNTDMLKTRHGKSMLLSTFIITTNLKTGNRDNLATVSTNDLMWNLQLKSTFMEDMVAFGTASNENPSDDSTQSTTRLFLIIENSVIDFIPGGHPAQAVIAAESLKLSTNIVSKSPEILIKIFLQNATFFLIDDKGSINEEVFTEENSHYYSSIKSYYRALGYAPLSSVDFLEVLVRLNKDEQLPQFDLELTNQNFLLETCSDSFQTLLEFANHISRSLNSFAGGKGNPAQLEVDEVQSNHNDDNILTDMLSSLDENAFGPPHPDCAKLASDVGEANLNFVEEYYAAETDSKKAANCSSSEESDMLEDYPSGFDLEDSGDDGKRQVSDKWKPVEAMMSPQLKEADFQEIDPLIIDAEDTVRPLDNEQLLIVEDYFTVPSLMEEEALANISQSLNHIRIRDFNFVWKLYSGNDWKKSRGPVDNTGTKNEPPGSDNARGKGKDVLFSTSPDFDYYMYEPELSATTPSGSEYASSAISSDKGYFDDDLQSFIDDASTLPDFSNAPAQSSNAPKKGRKRDKHRDKQGRSRSSQLDIKLIAINAEYQQYPLGVETASRARFSVRDVEIIDRVQTSMWKKFLSYLRPDSDTSPRETWSNMVRIELDGVRPVPNVPLEEMRLKIRLLPIRLHIDQDTLEFVIKFFNTTPSSESPAPPERKDNIYFQYCEILPIVLKFDYKPKHLDYSSLKGGNFAELVNLFRLEEADMMLLGVKLRGISGIERLLEELGSAWKPYIISTQVPNVVTGVAPVKTLVNLGSGLADLVLLPVEQYMKDGQLIRGIQRGASSFAKATTMEIIKLGTKLAVGAQVLLEQADDILSFDNNEPRHRRNSNHELDTEEDETLHPKSKYSGQPSDFNEGIELAYKSLSKNIGTATHSLITVPIQIYDRSGAQSSIRALIRGTPSAVLKPMIGATEAISKVLLGARNSIDPNKRLQMEDKYK